MVLKNLSERDTSRNKYSNLAVLKSTNLFKIGQMVIFSKVDDI